jgi:hypothetical protein
MRTNKLLIQLTRAMAPASTLLLLAPEVSATTGTIIVAPGQTTTLNEDHYGSVILSSNSTLDCQNKTIYQSSQSTSCTAGETCGISLGGSVNATVVNCNIQGFFSHGIYGNGGQNVRIISSNIRQSDVGIFLKNWVGGWAGDGPSRIAP